MNLVPTLAKRESGLGKPQFVLQLPMHANQGVLPTKVGQPRQVPAGRAFLFWNYGVMSGPPWKKGAMQTPRAGLT